MGQEDHRSWVDSQFRTGGDPNREDDTRSYDVLRRETTSRSSRFNPWRPPTFDDERSSGPVAPTHHGRASSSRASGYRSSRLSRRSTSSQELRDKLHSISAEFALRYPSQWGTSEHGGPEIDSRTQSVIDSVVKDMRSTLVSYARSEILGGWGGVSSSRRSGSSFVRV
jgi:hypothetical protein